MNQAQPPSNIAYCQPIDDLISQYKTDINKGLKGSEVESKFLKYGYNKLPKIKKSLWKIYLAPIFNFLIIILIISGTIVFILGDQTSTIITFTVVAINSITVITQQFSAQKALDSLKQITALKSIVLRDGLEFEIPTRELVPGDII